MCFRNVQSSISQGFTSDNQLCCMPHQLKVFVTDNMKALGQACYVVLGRDRRANALFSLAGLARGEMAPCATSQRIFLQDPQSRTSSFYKQLPVQGQQKPRLSGLLHDWTLGKSGTYAAREPCDSVTAVVVVNDAGQRHRSAEQVAPMNATCKRGIRPKSITSGMHGTSVKHLLQHQLQIPKR